MESEGLLSPTIYPGSTCIGRYHQFNSQTGADGKAVVADVLTVLNDSRWTLRKIVKLKESGKQLARTCSTELDLRFG